jgi:oligoribonuclease
VLLFEFATATDTVESVQEKLLVFVAKYCAPQHVPLCGNSVWVDRLFLRKNMPKLESYFHCRIVDVSTLKMLANCWFGMTKDDLLPKKNCHRVMDDIVESIEELKQYRAQLFK